MLKLPEYARRLGISRAQAHAWFVSGKLPHPATKIGPRTIIVDVPNDFGQGPKPLKTAIYARVSTPGRTEALNQQKLRILEWAATQGHKIDEIVVETASGMNPNRKKLNKLLADPTIGTIIVEHRERLARFNYELIESALKAQDRQILVIDPTEIEDDLVRDITEILTSLYSRIYGKRRAKIKAQKAVREALKNDTE